MNIYKKFTNNLLENYPLIWHSKVLQMLGLGLFLNIITYFIGYALMDIKILTSTPVKSFFFDSFYVLYYTIFCIVIFSLWALTYFKNNAIKKFYPVGQFYIFKLFSLLFLFIIVFLFGYYSFSIGAQHKIRSLTNPSEIQHDINAINRAFPFLGLENQYSFENRIYPDIYKNISYSVVGYKTSEPVVTESEDESLQNTYIRIGDKMVPCDSPISFYGGGKFEIDSTTYIAYFSHLVADSCVTTTYIDSFVDISKLSDFGDGKLINNSYQKISGGEYDFGILDYNKDIAPQIYRWVTLQQKDSVIQSLLELKSILNKYKIKSFFKTEVLYNYWAKNDFKAFEFPFMATEEYQVLNTNNDYETNSEINKELRPYKYFIEINQLTTLFENFNGVYTSIFQKDMILAILFMAFSMASFIVLFEFADRIRFLMTIPVSGVIFVFGLIITIFISSLELGGNELQLFIMILIGMAILTTALVGLFTNKISKKITSVFFYMSYLSFPILITTFIEWIHQLSSYEVKICGAIETKFGFSLDLAFIFIINIIGYFLMTLLVKKYLAKEE